MMKAIKFLLKALLCLFVVIVAAILALPLWDGPVIKAVANSVVPGMVKTDFRLGHLSLNPYTARFELGDVLLANPPGYPVPEAVTVGEVVFDVETASMLTDVVHVEEIKVKDVFVSVVIGGENNVQNFKQIQYNVSGGKEKYEAEQAVARAKTPARKPDAEKPAAEDRPQKKFIIDRLEVSGLRLYMGFVDVPLPPLILTDVGRNSGGATLQEAWNQILAAVMKSAGTLGDQFKAFGDLTGKTGKKAQAAMERTAAVLGGLTGEGMKTVSGTATKAAGDMAGAATKAVGDVTGGGMKAVGDGAKKALDSIKGLW